MSFKIKVSEVVVETVQSGKNRYQVANVAYTYNGEARTQKIMSFANPDVFKKVQEAKAGEEYDITLTKNDKGYTQWAKMEPAGASGAAEGVKQGRVLGSNYETSEERKLRQLHIVKQSSLAQAVQTLTPGAKAALDPQAVVALAQTYVDWVYGNSFNEEAVPEA
jgi:hypothetical protein